MPPSPPLPAAADDTAEKDAQEPGAFSSLVFKRGSSEDADCGIGGSAGSGGGAHDRDPSCVAALCKGLGERWDRFLDRPGDSRWAPGGRKLDIVRLERRLGFLTQRFKSEAPWWQFAIWLRQVGLIIAVSIPEMLGGEVSDAALGASAGLAELVLVISILLQLSATPYPFWYQNNLEVYLLCCSMVVILLGVIYAFVAVKSPVVEALLLFILLGSMAHAAVSILCRGRLVEAKPYLWISARLVKQSAMRPPLAETSTGSSKSLTGIKDRLSQIKERASKSSRSSLGLTSRSSSRSSLAERSKKSAVSTGERKSSPRPQQPGSPLESPRAGRAMESPRVACGRGLGGAMI